MPNEEPLSEKDYASTIRACEVMGKEYDDYSQRKLKKASMSLGLPPFVMESCGNIVYAFPRKVWYFVYPDAARVLFEAPL